MQDSLLSRFDLIFVMLDEVLCVSSFVFMYFFFLFSITPNVTRQSPIMFLNCIDIVRQAKPTVPYSNLVPQLKRYRRSIWMLKIMMEVRRFMKRIKDGRLENKRLLFLNNF